MGRRWGFAWVLAASLLVATALGPLGASPAAADTSTVLVAEQTYSTSSPACTFTSRLTETLANGDVTGLQHNATASCPGLAPPLDLTSLLTDTTMSSAGVGQSGLSTGLGFEVAWRWNHITNASSGVADSAYSHPKTAHHYLATLGFDADLPTGVTADQSPYCNQSGQFWSCEFNLSATPASAPEVGPAPVPAPVTQTLTVASASGGTCQLSTNLRAADPTTLTYTGRGVCPGQAPPGAGFLFIYGDRREASQLGAVPYTSCSTCSDLTVSGQIPAVKGKTYTATFYVSVDLVPGSAPPECTPFGQVGDLSSYQCEVSASVMF